MTFDRYAEWLARGRSHQAEDRFIDALLCYRRALRELPGASDAQFHIGEIAWRLGNRAEAIGAWRAAADATPAHVASRHALADALAANDELIASEEATRQVLALRPDEARAKALLVLLTAASVEVSDAALAQAIRTGAGWPLPLLARVVEQVFGLGPEAGFPQASQALIDAAATAVVGRGDEDALRRIALALAEAGEADGARAFADRYAAACRALHRASMPLLWPLRSAGASLRVGILVAQGSEGDAETLRAELTHAGIGDRIRCTVLVDRDGSADPVPAREDIRSLPPVPDAAARAVATLDLDVLIDLSGVRHPSGPLLALHPAREVWVVESAEAPAARPLADCAFASGDLPGVLVSALRERQASLATVPASQATAEELSERWEKAVLAHQRGDVEAARAGYANVLQVQPEHAPALYLAGVLAREARDHAVAREHFRSALRVADDYIAARIALVDSLAAA
ncbi:MAG TPA: tetratricopeptide repeat protein, partial [Casimicrobiaceae bacterium]